jgi:hypothetical protein
MNWILRPDQAWTPALIAVLLTTGPAVAGEKARSGFAAIIGQVTDWQESEVITTPWNLNRDEGGYGKSLRGLDRRRNFTFRIKAHQDAAIHTLEVKEEDRKPFSFRVGEVYQVVNRPVTTWNNFQCSFSVTDLTVDWTQQPRVRLIVSAEANYSTFRPREDEHPTAVCAYMLQVQPTGKDSDLPPDHWPLWYINNWIHFGHTVVPTVHYRYLANHGFNFWSWGVFDPPPNLKGKPSIGVYRLIWQPKSDKVNSVLLHTPGACELTNGVDVRTSRPPRVQARASVLRGRAPLKVDFAAAASDPDGDALLWYAWDFDGSNGVTFDATTDKVAHTFDKPGNYVVSLTVMDATGLPAHDHLRIAVTE